MAKIDYYTMTDLDLTEGYNQIARKVFDAIEPMIITLYSSELYKKDIELQTMKNQLDRAERILATLRKPSGVVVEAASPHVITHDYPDIHDVRRAIRAATEAAEKEVGHE